MTFLRSLSPLTWLVIACVAVTAAGGCIAWRHVGEGEDRTPVDDDAEASAKTLAYLEQLYDRSP